MHYLWMHVGNVKQLEFNILMWQWYGRYIKFTQKEKKVGILNLSDSYQVSYRTFNIVIIYNI